MNLLDLKPVERVVEILSPVDGSEIGIRVSLLSIEDDRLKKVKRRIHDERARLEARNKSFKSEEVEENLLAILFASMTGWEWYKPEVNLDGEKPAFNQNNVYKILKELPWFKSQIEEAVSDQQAFFQISK